MVWISESKDKKKLIRIIPLSIFWWSGRRGRDGLLKKWNQRI